LRQKTPFRCFGCLGSRVPTAPTACGRPADGERRRVR
jgi:hypothetical protein